MPERSPADILYPLVCADLIGSISIMSLEAVREHLRNYAPIHAALARNRAAMGSWKDADGDSLEIIPLTRACGGGVAAVVAGDAFAPTREQAVEIAAALLSWALKGKDERGDT